jgi:hypothetical protein
VREEAHLAETLGTLAPARIEQVELPLGYRLVETVDLSNWDGSPRGGGGLEGVAKDKETARECYQMPADRDHVSAIAALKRLSRLK